MQCKFSNAEGFMCVLDKGHFGDHFYHQNHPGSDLVNHPAHYGGGDNPHEHVKCATAWGLVENAFLYNATKYIARAGKKGPIVEDLKKAVWYLEAAIKHEESK